MNRTEPVPSAAAPRGRWNKEKIHKYIGSFRQSFFAHAVDPTFRERAASGGVITSLLAFCLQHRRIDGALVCRTNIVNSQVRPEFFIARNTAELIGAQGSKYIAVDFIRDALPLIRRFNGLLAVTALPCDISKLRSACKLDQELARKITLMLSLFCGHNSLPELTDLVVEKISPSGAALSDFRYRQGHWRGQLRAVFEKGQVVERPFSVFSNYQNLFFFCQAKCHHCHDHTGYDADISTGDIWSARMRCQPIKHNAVIIRTAAGQALFQEAVNEGAIFANPEPIEAICVGQARSIPFHYNISARAKAGSRLGFKIKDSVNERVRWNDFLAAWIVLFNDRLSQSPRGQRLIRLAPRFLLRLYLVFLKGLESF